ncbi:MAG: GatB/YqeY domain-containing protein [Candidatus Bathyarchaeota archaeon]|nr:GatB/YqeY domain-containing protein [Candidatus Bathyarchaeota archaeon]
MLENKLRNDLREATLNRNDVKKNTIKIVLGEIPRLNKNAGEKATDDEVHNVIFKRKG